MQWLLLLLLLLKMMTRDQLMMASNTGLLPKEGDTFLQGRRMLYPSPVAGRGSRLFVLFHVLVHITSAILSISFVAEASDHLSNNKIEADSACAILSMLLLLVGIVAIISISLTSKTPFSSHGITLAFTLWYCPTPTPTPTLDPTPTLTLTRAFLGAFALLILSFAAGSKTLADDHNARVLALFCGLSQSLGLSFIFAGMVTGVSASALPMDDRVGNN